MSKEKVIVPIVAFKLFLPTSMVTTVILRPCSFFALPFFVFTEHCNSCQNSPVQSIALR